MEIKGQVIVVTGAASGIGEALCRRFAQEGAAAVYCADVNGEGAARVADEIGGVAMTVDVRDEQQVAALIQRAEQDHGRIDLLVSNAGIFVMDKSHAASATNEEWQRIWEINVMAHIYAARAALPGMIARGQGYFLITASAAGLLSQIGSAPYSVTKHGAVAYAESLSIAHGDDGIRVSALCPQAVRTAMVEDLGGPGVAGVDGMLETDVLCDSVVAGLRSEQFLILPHPDVGMYIQHKAGNYDRWLGGMRKLRRRFLGQMPKG